MAGAFNQIRGALETALSSHTASGWTKFFDGQNVEPVEESNFMVGKLLMAPTTSATIGLDHLLEHRGIYQVTLYTPAARGAGMAYTEADNLHITFKPGTLVTSGTVSCRITDFTPGPSDTSDNWFALIVNIGYHAFTTLPS